MGHYDKAILATMVRNEAVGKYMNPYARARKYPTQLKWIAPY